MVKSSVSRRSFMKQAAVVGGGVLLAGCVTEMVQEAVSESAPMTAEELLTPLGLMPGLPDHAKGWTTALPDPPEGMPLSPPVTVTSFTRTDAYTLPRRRRHLRQHQPALHQGAVRHRVRYPLDVCAGRGARPEDEPCAGRRGYSRVYAGNPAVDVSGYGRGRPGGRHYRCLRSDRAIESAEVGDQTIPGRAPGAQRPSVSHGDPKRVHELASVNGASETPAMSGGSPCKNSWFQIERI